MAEFVRLAGSGLTALREIDERLVSYNVEMTEVTGVTMENTVEVAPGGCTFIVL